jgi:hypothetical protein
VRRAVAWLISKQRADGAVFQESDCNESMGDGLYQRKMGYSPAIGMMALSEAAGMARIPTTVDAAQKAVDYCVNIHQQGNGGWTYGTMETPRTAVAAWFVLALKSAKIAGLKIEPVVFEKAQKFFDACSHPIEGGVDTGYGPPKMYWYTVGSATSSTGGNKVCRLQAMGNLCNMFMGKDPAELSASVEWFINKWGVPEYTEQDRKLDFYYWYYGTMCTFQLGGETWKKWNEGLKAALIPTQCKNGDEKGSWDPAGDFSEIWGRVGQTAMACLCLEVYYRYAQLHKK